MALAFAFGFLNKYNIFFLLLSLVPALLLTEHRKVFLKKEFYGSIGLALLLISPNLIWQFQNDFPVFKHLQELAELQLVNVNRMDFVKEQFLLFSGGLLVSIASFIGFIKYTPFKAFRVVFYSFWICMCLFIYFKAKPYYAIGLYPVILAFGAVYISEMAKTGWKRKVAYVLPVLPMALMFLVSKALFPILSPEEIKKLCFFKN
jgi:4-amino-4-deoxy-L-arabinose transferase-like glycosyltransferase